MLINKILVPTELNDISETAARFAVNLGSQLNMDEIILLNVVVPAHHQQVLYTPGQPVDATGFPSNDLIEMITAQHTDMINEKAKELSINNLKIRPVVKINNSIADINKYMKEYDAGLIVCGSYDSFSFMEILFGSGTEKMVRKIDYPMIVITEKPMFNTIKNIAVAIDVEEKTNGGMDSIIYVARHLHAHLQLVYVIDNDGLKAAKAIEKLQQLAKKYNISDYSINVLNNESTENGLYSFVRKFNPDMMAILSQGKGKLNKLIFGSKSEEMIKELKIPVFVSKSE
jgi:nucleotide-binding universal stress UspA family protein